MDPIPSNIAQLLASDMSADELASGISVDDPILKDKLACDQIEQVVVNALNELVSV